MQQENFLKMNNFKKVKEEFKCYKNVKKKLAEKT